MRQLCSCFEYSRTQTLDTVKPWFNGLYNEVLDATNDFLYPNNSKIYEKAGPAERIFKWGG